MIHNTRLDNHTILLFVLIYKELKTHPLSKLLGWVNFIQE